MDASELASKMLEAEKLNSQLKALEEEITSAVLELKETQKVGKVKASFTTGRRELDWKTPALTAPQETIEKFTTSHEVVDWDAVAEEAPETVKKFTSIVFDFDYGAICKEAKLKPVVIKEGNPSVNITYS